MNQEHRSLIQRNYTNLVNGCNLRSLLPLLIQKQVFMSEMVEKYLNTNADERNIKRNLFLDIQKRGPQAFDKLVEALCETGQRGLAELLVAPSCITYVPPIPEPVTHLSIQPSSQTFSHAHPFVQPTNVDPPDFQGGFVPECPELPYSYTPLNINVVCSTNLMDNPTKDGPSVYPTHSQSRAAVLIINNVKYINDVQTFRTGADVDSYNLKNLFRKMGGCYVDFQKDLTSTEMSKAINNFIKNPELRYVDMAIVIIMSHGGEEENRTYLVGTDDMWIFTSDIENMFDNYMCPSLFRKPKIFIYQTCRGPLHDYAVEMRRRVETDGGMKAMVRRREDMLIAHSTLPGYKSNRDLGMGSWYIQCICEIFMAYAHKCHIEDLLKMVDEKMALLRTQTLTVQTSTYTNEGFKVCYLNPGIYIDEDGQVQQFQAR